MAAPITQDNPVHFLAFPWFLPGHINPLLHVCNRLISTAKFRITFVNTHDNHMRMFQTPDPITKDGIDFVPVLEGKESDQAAPDLFPAGRDGVEEVVRSTFALEQPMRELVLGMLQKGVALKGIIADSFIPWIQDMATEFRMVSVAFSTIPATMDLFCFHMRRLREEGFMPVNTRTTGDKLIQFIPGLPSFSPFDIPLSFHDEHPIIDLITLAYERVRTADWMLSSTVEEIEPDVVSTTRRHFITRNNYLPVGPFLPQEHITGTSSREKLSADEIHCLEWLDSRTDSSVLYIAFGSVAVLSSEQFQELVAGLESSDEEVSILWSMRPNFVEGKFPKEIFEEFSSGDRVRVVPWAPQMQVLRHPAVGGFLTHCGWNSVLEGVCGGVAMIGWPCQAEQNSNCSFLARRKLVLRLKDHRKVGASGMVRKEEVSKAVTDLMHGEVGNEIRRNVRELKEKVRTAVSTGGSSEKNLKAFLTAMSNI